MSEVNVEIVREQFEATNRQDFAQPMADWADELQLVAIDGPLAGTYSGRKVVGDVFGDWFRAFGGDVHFDVLDIRASGDAVAVAARHTARGRYSGIELEGDYFYEYRLRAGKIVRIQFHRSWLEALEAVGLRE